MPRRPRIALRVAVAAAALLAIGAAVFVTWLDPEAHRARIEESLSRRLGMEVSVHGPIALRWRPRAYLVLRDVRARKQGADIALVKEAVLGLELGSLLRRRPEVHSIALHDAELALARLADGRFNFQKDPVPGQARPARALPDLSFSRVFVHYSDARLEHRIEGRGCRGEVHNLHTAGGERRLLAGLSFDAAASCDDVRSGTIALPGWNARAHADVGVIEWQPFSARLLDVQSSGRVRADFSAAVPSYQVQQTLRQFRVEQLLKALSLDKWASGRMDLRVDLALQGRTMKELQQSMRGTVSLRGQGLTYHRGNIDEQFERFESSQTLNLFDVGAMLLAGPAGLLVTKGYEFAGLAQGAQGESEIRTLESRWSIERGVARAADVALATPANRVAIKGSIDLVADRYQDLTLALVDAKGCVRVQQRIEGPLKKPVIDKPGPIEALAAPAVRLLKKGAELVGADACDVFYAGAVPAPAPK
jgi:AsmA protein